MLIFVSPFCRHLQEKGATFSRNPLFYLLELAGVEPASEITTSSECLIKIIWGDAKVRCES
ncbi:hypothetical protein B1R44_03955 [Serratia marcescens]|nr:hypothetical protein B1R44_03955 [Serratia marcescens]